MRLKFVDVLSGCGGASLGAERTGLFDAALALDSDPDALSLYQANFPSASVANVTLPMEQSAFFALLPTGVVHAHFSPPTTSFLRRGVRVECTALLQWSLDTALAAPVASFSIDCGASADAHALLVRYKDKVEWVEVDAADLGSPAHKLRLVVAPRRILAPFALRSRYCRTYTSIKDAFRAAGVELRGAFVRHTLLSPTAPREQRVHKVLSVDDRANALSTRLSLFWTTDPYADDDVDYELTPFTLEQAALVAGLGNEFRIGPKRDAARRLIGASTPPVLLTELLQHYLRHTVVEEEDDDADGLVVKPPHPGPRRRKRLRSQQTLLPYLARAPALAAEVA